MTSTITSILKLHTQLESKGYSGEITINYHKGNISWVQAHPKAVTPQQIEDISKNMDAITEANQGFCEKGLT